MGVKMKAFPSLEWISSDGKQSGEGMDLRDYFAGQALTTMNFHIKPVDDTDSTAEHCYKMADAMMRARK
jgi:hypothetical protein